MALAMFFQARVEYVIRGHHDTYSREE